MLILFALLDFGAFGVSRNALHSKFTLEILVLTTKASKMAFFKTSL